MEPTDPQVRLEVLEKRIGRLRLFCWTGFAIGVAALVFAVKGYHGPTSEGRLWMARDESGRLRAMFGVSNDGVGLTMYDSAGQMRLDIGLAPGGVPGLLMMSNRGEPVAAINLIDGAVPTVRLTNVAEQARIEMVPRAGQPALILKQPERPDTVIARRGVP